MGAEVTDKRIVQLDRFFVFLIVEHHRSWSLSKVIKEVKVTNS